MEVIAGPAFYVGLPLALVFCFVAKTGVELERVFQADVEVLMAAGKVSRRAVGSFLSGDKRASLAGGTGFGWGVGVHRLLTRGLAFLPELVEERLQ